MTTMVRGNVIVKERALTSERRTGQHVARDRSPAATPAGTRRPRTVI
jgi:hypothetical protein